MSVTAEFATIPIFVRVTGSGSGGITKFVLDGEAVAVFLKPILKTKRDLSAAVSGDLLYGKLFDSRGQIVDEVVIATVGKKESGTGNDQVELSCHGGEGALAAVEETLLAAGIQRGRDTALMERAHLRGKFSLIAIEAELRLARASTPRQAEWLLASRAFQTAWERHGFNLALAMRSREQFKNSVLHDAVEACLIQAQHAKQLLRQHHVVILGHVNAGKSTLANALARSERHIISAIPGTTLDRLDTPLEIRGLNVLLSDTAGLRESTDPIEREGQGRGLRASKTADLRLIVLDGSRAPSESDIEMISQAAHAGPSLVVLNKCDLGIDEDAQGLGFVAGGDLIALSALNREGLPALSAGIEAALLPATTATNGPFTIRHESVLRQIKSDLQKSGPVAEILTLIRKLVGIRPDAEQLNLVLTESVS